MELLKILQVAFTKTSSSIPDEIFKEFFMDTCSGLIRIIVETIFDGVMYILVSPVE